MPDFVGIATADGKLSWVQGHGAKLVEYLKKKPGEFYRVSLESAYKSRKKNPKTSAQLGYYWGLLLPEIHKQLVSDGHTITIKFGTVEKEVIIPIEASHEAVTALCGNIGENGSHLRLSDCELPECVRFIDNVLDLASQLRMNVDELKAVRPK